MKSAIKYPITITEEDSNKIKKVLLELLCKFDDFCKKNDLTYYLFAGTLLGAVRHKGFIPWDDDIDVVMPLEDYHRLINMDPKCVSDDTFVQSYKSDPEFIQSFMKLRKDGTIFKEFLTQHWNIHHGIYIDIFPMDGIPDDPKEERKYFKILNKVGQRMLGIWTTKRKGLKLLAARLYHWIKSGHYAFISPKKAALAKIKFLERHPNNGSKKVLIGFYSPKLPRLDRNDYGEPSYFEFEGGYSLVLRTGAKI